jgi:hypothetical protein
MDIKTTRSAGTFSGRRTLACLAVLALASAPAGCARSDACVELDAVRASRRNIDTVAEFDMAVARGDVILHIDVAWSVEAVASRRTVAQFADALSRDAAAKNIVLFRVDCTEQEGPLWDRLERWFSDQQQWDRPLAAGGGAIIWVRGGRIVRSELCAMSVGVHQLVKVTAAEFNLALAPANSEECRGKKR